MKLSKTNTLQAWYIIIMPWLTILTPDAQIRTLQVACSTSRASQQAKSYLNRTNGYVSIFKYTQLSWTGDGQVYFVFAKLSLFLCTKTTHCHSKLLFVDLSLLWSISYHFYNKPFSRFHSISHRFWDQLKFRGFWNLLKVFQKSQKS